MAIRGKELPQAERLMKFCSHKEMCLLELKIEDLLNTCESEVGNS